MPALEGPNLTVRPFAPSHAAIAMAPIVDAAADLGVDVVATLAGYGLQRASFRSLKRIDCELATQLAIDLEAAAGNTPLALHAAERVPFGSFGLVHQLIGCAGTLRRAIAWGTRFSALLSDQGRLELEEGKATASVVVAGDAASIVSPTLVEFMLATAARAGQAAMGRARPGEEVRFVHQAHKSVRTYEEFFGTRVVFGAERYEIRFPRIYLDLPMPGKMCRESQLAQAAARELDEERAPLEFLPKVRRLIADALPNEPNLDTVAASLGIRRRTLQRRLHEENTSFEALVDEARRTLGQNFIGVLRLPLEVVAHRLGFADGSSFARAFRRWTAMSPTEYQRRGSSAE